MPQRVQLPRVEPLTARLEPLLKRPREREIHVVAAEQDVIPDRDALEGEVTVLLGDRDQREVRRPAPDIADENQIADADVPPPSIALRIEPRVERRLWL